MNKQKALSQQINQLKQEKKLLKLQAFTEFLTKHFGREIKTGDIIQAEIISNIKQYSVIGAEYIEGSYQLDCHAYVDGVIQDTIQKAIASGSNLHNRWAKTQLKQFKFKLAI
jgi:hypothetical protein